MVRTNFTRCAIDYIGNQSLADQWAWTGPVYGITVNRTSQISVQGCRAVCGGGNDYYPWSEASNTITTWVLPILGVLLQAPFESNAFWRTMFTTARWVGSPMVSLSYTLWNISSSSKAAKMIDMAVRFDDHSSFVDSELASIRDSFYILMNMNQYVMKPMASMTKEAEGLLRIVLFSKDLRLLGTNETLKEIRGELARVLRERRRRGVVPVFISTGWFLFSLAISIQFAFTQLGQSIEAHDLALGLLLGWLPIFIMCGIVDRNPVAAEDSRLRINETIDIVARSLRDETVRAEFIQTIYSPRQAAEMARRIEKISANADFLAGDFFKSFGGQGRERWHYGCAQPILADIEHSYIAERGRNWLSNEPEARTELVLGSVDRGLFFFDFRMLYPIFSSFVIVGGSALGAFILSYFTPTVGLGCHSLGYLIFCVISLSLLILEFVVWWLSSPEREEERLMRRHRDTDGSMCSTIIATISTTTEGLVQRFKTQLRRYREGLEGWLIETLPPILFCYLRNRWCKKIRQVQRRLQQRIDHYHNFGLRDWSERLFFRPVEISNLAWLTYVSMAQTFGSYNNCLCLSSIYGTGGGYVDLNLVNQAPRDFVFGHWKTGTILACIIMVASMAYVVLEWCLQSHLSAENPDNARRGLQRVRRFRRVIQPILYPMTTVHLAINRVFNTVIWPFREKQPMQRTLVWTHNITA